MPKVFHAQRRPHQDAPHILLINPWIHDFAAYDVWSRPYGLLYLGGLLRGNGLKVSFIDCLDRFHPLATSGTTPFRHGRGPYLKTAIPKPKGLEDVPRTYSRYGIPPDWFHQDLEKVDPAPDLILVTSIMTYWYPGVVEAIAELRSVWPRVPVVLGGIYARLCTAHARLHSGADEVVADDGEGLWDLVERYTGFAVQSRFDFDDWEHHPYPAFDLQSAIHFIPLLTRKGCPFDCAYCASRFLQPTSRVRSPASILAEIIHWHDHHGVADFAFYDDALLVDASNHAIPLLEGIIASGRPLRFHTPNALHIRGITAEVARLMARAGFHTVRLGLETTAFETRNGLDHKVTEGQFFEAVDHLKAAGFDARQVGAYLLAGLPGQSMEALFASIDVVKAAGITPIPAYYTPIPHTRLWETAVKASRYDLDRDPVFTNNAVWPCRMAPFSWSMLSGIKQHIAMPH